MHKYFSGLKRLFGSKKSVNPLLSFWKLSVFFLLIGGIKTSLFAQNKPAVDTSSSWADKLELSAQFYNDYPVFKAGSHIEFKWKIASTNDQPIAGLLHCAIQTFNGGNFISKSQKFYIDRFGTVYTSVSFAPISAGCYRVYIRVTDAAGINTDRSFGFAVAPDQIEGKGEIPADFDDFWSNTLQKLEKVPLTFTRNKNANLSSKTQDVYDLKIQSYGGEFISGYFSIPNGKTNLPVILRFPDFGGSAVPDFSEYPDCAKFYLLIQGQDSDSEIQKFLTEGLTAKETYNYRKIYMDCIRAIDFAVNQPEIDSNKVIVMGHGQGAALAVVCAALDPRVKLCLPDALSLSDLPDRMTLDARPTTAIAKSQNPNALSTQFAYFDAQHFAHKINCPILLGIGMMDMNNPPLTQFAFFNKLQHKTKAFYAYPEANRKWIAIQAGHRSEWINTYFFSK